MPVTTVDKNAQQHSMTITAEFDASPERVWQLWADPRQLDRWWGPPGYPATFWRHALTVGSKIAYYMTSPEGERNHAHWEILESEPPRRLVFLNGFALEDGTPNLDAPQMTLRVSIDPIDGGRTSMAIETVFADLGAMEQILAMGMEEGMSLALGQIDGILAEDLVLPA